MLNKAMAYIQVATRDWSVVENISGTHGIGRMQKVFGLIEARMN